MMKIIMALQSTCGLLACARTYCTSAFAA